MRRMRGRGRTASPGPAGSPARSPSPGTGPQRGSSRTGGGGPGGGSVTPVTPVAPAAAAAGQPHSSRDNSDEEREEGEELSASARGGAVPVEEGVRYITEALLRRVSRQEDLALVRSLNLALARDGGKKFRYIENLERCERLEVLTLSHNVIEKMEHMERLGSLRELHLSHNLVRKIEGLEHMAQLQTLALASNQLEAIPAWLPRRLRCLRSLDLRDNNISSLHDVSRLKALQGLVSLALAGNPVAALPHYRAHTVFHLRSLERLDAQPVSDAERRLAHQRFHLEEVERLEAALAERQAQLESSSRLQEESAAALLHREQQLLAMQQERGERDGSMHELQRELHTKNQLLKQKMLELTHACQKQYELEQELAFYKIDAKFDSLGHAPPHAGGDDDDDESPQQLAPGESPYIGKARYKRNEFAGESRVRLSPARHAALGSVQSDGAAAATPAPGAGSGDVTDTVDQQLALKRLALAEAERRLAELLQEVEAAERRNLAAAQELQLLEDAASQGKALEQHREALRRALARKLELLGRLRVEAEELERRLEAQRTELGRRGAQAAQLRREIAEGRGEDGRGNEAQS
ncbi:centriolin-like [Lampetra planeri]